MPTKSPATKFKDLMEGQTFDFIKPDSFHNTFFEPCRKVSTRGYIALLPDGKENPQYGKMQVGSIRVEVYHVGVLS